jgi:hypothetical protein
MRETILLDALKEIIKMDWDNWQSKEIARKALTDWASAPKEGLTPEQVLALHAKNYNKTVEQDEKSLYFLQLNGFEAINAMKAYAAQFQSPSPAPESGGEEKKFTLDNLFHCYYAGEAAADFDRKKKQRDSLRAAFFKTHFLKDFVPNKSTPSTSSNSIEEYHAVEFAGYWQIKTQPFYEHAGKNVLDAEELGRQTKGSARIHAASVWSCNGIHAQSLESK